MSYIPVSSASRNILSTDICDALDTSELYMKASVEPIIASDIAAFHKIEALRELYQIHLEVMDYINSKFEEIKPE